jgi:soluble lytic murein transglycosylase-like protein
MHKSHRGARILRNLAASFLALAAIGFAKPPTNTPQVGKHASHKVGPAPVGHAAKSAAPLSLYAQEEKLNAHQLVDRWNADIDEASKRVRIPSDWVRAVLIEESGGRTMMAENAPITSSMGAMGLMQLMPDTWREMQRIYGLGNDPYNPHDNILAGTAELRSLYWEYGYPGLFVAYNDGPGMIEAHRRLQQMLPAETVGYMLDIASILRSGSRAGSRNMTLLTAPPSVPEQADPPSSVPGLRDDEDNDDDYYDEN